MKKILLALFLIVSLAACSNDSNKKYDWIDELEGNVGEYTITYNNKKRKIVVQVANDTEMNFYFNQSKKENYCTITLDFGHFDMDTVLDTMIFDEFSQDGYEDLYYIFYDDDNRCIKAECVYEPLLNSYYCERMFSPTSKPSSEYAGFWELNGDPDSDEILINADGLWSTIASTGDVKVTGYLYKNGDGYDLLDNEGQYRGYIILEDDCLIVTIDGNEEYYYYSN